MKHWILVVLLALGVVSVAGAQTVENAEAEKEPLLGIVHTLSDGNLVQIVIENKKWVVRFYDAEQEPIDPLFAKAIVRYEGFRDKLLKELIVLAPRGGVLTNPKNIYPEYDYWVTVTLKGEEGSDKKVVINRKRLKLESESPEKQ